MLLDIKGYILYKLQYIRTRRELLNFENFELIALIYCFSNIIPKFIECYALVFMCYMAEIFTIFSIWGISLDVFIKFFVFEKSLSKKTLGIISLLILVSILLICDMHVFDMIISKKLATTLFFWYLFIRYYISIFSLRKIIKIFTNEFYRHIIKIIVYFFVLSIPLLAIGGYNLYFYHQKTDSYSFNDVVDEGKKVLSIEHVHDSDQKIVFWLIGLVGVMGAKDLIDNVKTKVLIFGIKGEK